MNACVRYINLAALIPKLNKQALLTYEEERDITNDRLKVRERIIRLLECIRKKKDGWTKFLTALEEETTHKGHATLLDELKKLPSIESRCASQCRSIVYKLTSLAIDNRISYAAIITLTRKNKKKQA